MYKYLKKGHKEDGGMLFTVVFSDRRRGNEHKFAVSVGTPNTKKHFTVQMTKHWHRLPKEVVGSPSFEIFRRHLNMVQGNRL